MKIRKAGCLSRKKHRLENADDMAARRHPGGKHEIAQENSAARAPAGSCA
jgi:hypothetical protein